MKNWIRQVARGALTQLKQDKALMSSTYCAQPSGVRDQCCNSRTSGNSDQTSKKNAQTAKTSLARGIYDHLYITIERQYPDERNQILRKTKPNPKKSKTSN